MLAPQVRLVRGHFRPFQDISSKLDVSHKLLKFIDTLSQSASEPLTVVLRKCCPNVAPRAMLANMATRKMELTKLALDNLRPADPGARYEVADVIVPGLRIRVTDACVPQGRFKGKAAVMTFVVVGRFSPGRSPTRRALGHYDRSGGSLSIQAARERAREWKEKIASGVDPAAEARDRAAAAAFAIEEEEKQRRAEEEAWRRRKVLRDYVETYADEVLVHHRSGGNTRRALDGRRGLLTEFLEREPSSLTRAEIVQTLKMRAKVAPIGANRQLACASAFFNWCVTEELLAVNPIAKVKKPSKETMRDRHHSLAELREIWAGTAKLGYPFQQLFRLLIVLPMRREENAAMPLAELELGPDEVPDDGVWTLPSGRTKRANALRIPLSSLARSIIGEAIDHPDRPANSPFVFSTTGETSVSGFSKAKRRLEAEIRSARAKKDARLGVAPVEMPHWTIHDLRTTFNTLACDVLEIDAHVADRILNHVATATTSKVMRIYNRSELFEPRKKALQAWAELLDREVIKPPNGVATASIGLETRRRVPLLADARAVATVRA